MGSTNSHHHHDHRHSDKFRNQHVPHHRAFATDALMSLNHYDEEHLPTPVDSNHPLLNGHKLMDHPIIFDHHAHTRELQRLASKHISERWANYKIPMPSGYDEQKEEAAFQEWRTTHGHIKEQQIHNSKRATSFSPSYHKLMQTAHRASNQPAL